MGVKQRLIAQAQSSVERGGGAGKARPGPDLRHCRATKSAGCSRMYRKKELTRNVVVRGAPSVQPSARSRVMNICCAFEEGTQEAV